METCINLNDLNKWFGTFQVLDSINLSISTAEKVVICGPSGSGKSTLIRCVNALESFQFGAVNVCGIRLKYSVGIRVSEEEEYNGMDVCEFGLHAYPEFVERQAGI